MTSSTTLRHSLLQSVLFEFVFYALAAIAARRNERDFGLFAYTDEIPECMM